MLKDEEMTEAQRKRREYNQRYYNRKPEVQAARAEKARTAPSPEEKAVSKKAARNAWYANQHHVKAAREERAAEKVRRAEDKAKDPWKTSTDFRKRQKQRMTEDPEYERAIREKQRENTRKQREKKKAEDPEYQAKVKAYAKERYNSPEQKAKRARAAEEKAQREETQEEKARRERINARRHERYSTIPEVRAGRQASNRKSEQKDPERAAEAARNRVRKHREQQKMRAANDPEFAAELKAQLKPTPEKAREYRTRWLAKPGNKAKQHAASKAAAKSRCERDPEYKAAVLARSRRWYATHRQQVIDQIRERYQTDLHYRIAHNLRCRLREAIKHFRIGKKHVSAADFGCSTVELVAHIESTWLPGMTWGNYGTAEGEWSIDHVKPMAAFDLTLPEEQAAACHYTNLQAMWHVENLRKHSKWNPHDS